MVSLKDQTRPILNHPKCRQRDENFQINANVSIEKDRQPGRKQIVTQESKGEQEGVAKRQSNGQLDRRKRRNTNRQRHEQANGYTDGQTNGPVWRHTMLS